MSENILKSRIKHAINTENNWKTKDPILYEGEIAFSSDNYKYKIGDGKKKWSELDYTNYSQSDIDNELNKKVDNTENGSYSILSKLPIYTADPKDDTYFIRQDTGGASVFGKVTFSTIWNYIKSKADSTYLKLTGGTITGVTSFTNTTASTSKSTGAVKVSGGVGVSGRMSANEIMVGDGCTIKYDSTNKCINFTFE